MLVLTRDVLTEDSKNCSLVFGLDGSFAESRALSRNNSAIGVVRPRLGFEESKSIHARPMTSILPMHEHIRIDLQRRHESVGLSLSENLVPTPIDRF